MRNKKIFSFLMIIAFVFIVSVPAFAASKIDVIWNWLLDDPDVKYHRYQLNGEEEGRWTVVGGDVSSLEIKGLASDEDYYLYLQRSYDGVNWSASAVSLIYGVNEPVASTVSESTVAESDTDDSSNTSRSTASSSPQSTPEAQAGLQDRYAVSLLFKLGAGLEHFGSPYWRTNNITGIYENVDLLDRLAGSAEVAVEFKNIVASKYVGMTIRMDLGVDFVPTSDWSYAVSNLLSEGLFSTTYHIDVNLLLDIQKGAMNFYLGGGAGFSLLYTCGCWDGPFESSHTLYDLYTDAESDTALQSAWYPTAVLGLRVGGKLFSAGAEIEYRMYMPEMMHYITTSLIFGFTF